jgi:hypothetical protein
MKKIPVEKWIEALCKALEEAAVCAEDGKISIIDALKISAAFLKALLN